MTALSATLTPGGTFTVAGRPVARIGYGMGQLSRRTAASGEDQEARALLHRAFELGVRLYDTAQFYADGLANRLLRDALGGHREDLVIATKVGARPTPGQPVPLTAAQRPGELRETVEANLRTLGTDRVDLVYLRRMDFLPGLLADGEQLVPIEDQFAELEALRDAGKLVGIGLSHATAAQVTAALPFGLGAVQNIYHLLDRHDERLLQLCQDNGVAWIPYFPLGGGGAYASIPKVTENPAVLAVAAELDVTASQLGLAWQLAHSPNTLIIPGTANMDHLGQNVDAGKLTLPPELLAQLEAATVCVDPAGM